MRQGGWRFTGYTPHTRINTHTETHAHKHFPMWHHKSILKARPAIVSLFRHGCEHVFMCGPKCGEWKRAFRRPEQLCWSAEVILTQNPKELGTRTRCLTFTHVKKIPKCNMQLVNMHLVPNTSRTSCYLKHSQAPN